MSRDCPYWGRFHHWTLVWFSPRYGSVCECACGRRCRRMGDFREREEPEVYAWLARHAGEGGG